MIGRRWLWGLATVAIAALIGARMRHSDRSPRVPRSDDEILERLSRPAADPRARAIASLRRRLAAGPRDLAVATRLAELDIEESRARSDPRYLGYAQAALSPWWNVEDAPGAVLLLRATIRQSRHDFAGALHDLDRAVEVMPASPQAWLTRAVVLAVRGDYTNASACCQTLRPLAPPLIAEVCAASIDGITGSARAAATRLQNTLYRARADAATLAWAHSVVGELFAWTGDDAGAEVELRRAVELDPSDDYARAAYADLMLDLNRPAEAAALCAERTQNDAILLRLVLAETRLGRSEAAAHAATLRERFAASRERGDALHQREESRFALAVDHAPARALELARANWQVQHEPWDARVFLEAALGAHDAAAAAPALDWLAATRFEDPRLGALARALRRSR